MYKKIKNIILKPLKKLGISYSNQANAFWSLLDALSAPFFNFLYIPVLVNSVGLEKYGVYVFVMALVGLLSISGLGVNVAITYNLAKGYEVQSSKEKAEYLGSAILIVLSSTLLMSIFCFLSASFFSENLGEKYILLKNESHLLYTIFFLMMATQLELTVSGALRGLQLFKVSSVLEFITKSTIFFILIITAFSTHEVTFVLDVLIFLTFASFLIKITALKIIIGFNFRELKCNNEKIKNLWLFGKWMSVQNLSTILYSIIDKIIVGIFFGAHVLATYNILTSVTQFVHLLPSNAISFIFSKISKNQKIINLKLLNSSIILVTALAFFIAIIISMFKVYIFSYFKIDDKYDLFFYGLLISYLILSMHITMYYASLGLGMHKYVSIQCFLSSFLSLMFVGLIPFVGIIGAIFSKVAYAATSLYLYYPLTRKIKDLQKDIKNE